MASVSKTHSAANGQSDTLKLGPGETATVSIVVAGGDTFEGLLQIQRARSPLGPWEAAQDSNGAALADYTTINAGTTTVTVKNNDPAHAQYIRTRVGAYTNDAAAVTIADVSGDQIAVLFAHPLTGAPLIVLTDSGIKFLGSALEIAGTLTAAGAVSGNGVSLTAAQLQITEGTISAADITSTSAGKLGHANGYPLVAAPGADYGAELVAVLMVYDRDTATYGAGGNLSINVEAGGAALTGIVSAANSIGKGSDAIVIFRPLAAAAEVVTANKGFNLVAAAAFTNPGTAAGVVRFKALWRKHALALA